MSAFTSIENPVEGRKVDFFMEVGMDASNTFFRNATVDDVIDAIEATEDQWPTDRVLELASRLTSLVNGGPIPDETGVR